MITMRRSIFMLGALTSALVAAATQAHGQTPTTGEEQYLKDNQAAMTRMMASMAAKPTGDIDADFAATMIPHHQGAIDMAEAELKYGRNDRLRRIAQEIIVDQQQEIAAMRLALDRTPPAAATSAGERGPSQLMTMPMDRPR